MSRTNLLNNWRKFSANEIVNKFTKMYPNEGSRSSLLSLFKSELRSSDDPPPKKYIDSLMLDPSIYDKINKSYAEKKHTEGYNVKYIANIHDSVYAAFRAIKSNQVPELWPAVVLCSGFRPIEILTADFSRRTYDPTTPHNDFYINVSNLAKKRGSEPDIVRAHPLLCPADLWLRAVDLIRAELPLGQNNVKTRQKHGYKFIKWDRRLFPLIPQVTNSLLRRIYASYAYYVYRGDFRGNVDRLTFIKDVLGHSSISSSAVYNLVEFDTTQIIDVFTYFSKKR